MSQLKAQLAVALKHGFWIGSVLVLLTSVVMWYLSTNALITDYESKASKIKTDFNTVSAIDSQLSVHPNQLSHEKMEALISKRQDEVLRSWKLLYDRQRPILTWPKELNEDFRSEFENKIPIEEFIEFSETGPDPTVQTLRIQYARYIKNVLPEIAEIAGAEWRASFSSSDMGGMGMDGMGMDGMGMDGMRGMGRDQITAGGLEDAPLVQWSTQSQSNVLKDLFPWRNRAEIQPPTTLEIYYSQENIWILKQLLGIVAKVNGEARQPYQAKIREIKRLSIGRSVSFDVGHVDIPGMSLMAMEEMDTGMDDMGMDGMGMGMMMVLTDPSENRYVDAAKKPIPASSLRSAITSNQPSDVTLAVAKRVPVMLSVKIDQRSVPELIAACGSVPLMVEVQQVRVLPPTASDVPGMDDEMDMGMGGMGMGGMGMGAWAPVRPPYRSTSSPLT